MYGYLETYKSKKKSHYIIPFQKIQKKKQYVIAIISYIIFHGFTNFLN